jgi:nucleoside-diphosphate-sugar epimerase
MNVLLTGATGFIGSRLVEILSNRNDIDLTAATRKHARIMRAKDVFIPSISSTTDWSDALLNKHVVIHAAARAHIMNEREAEPIAAYRKINVDGTINLARQASNAGVKRFIFLSSIKVNGEKTFPGQPFTAADVPAPVDAYGISKLEAEIGLQQIAENSEMEIVIIRPPLVYGPGVKGNFAKLIRSIKLRLPLPFGAIENRRSMVAVDNLIDLVVRCLAHPAAANQVFLVSDGDDLSTTDLLRALAHAGKIDVTLIPFPRAVLLLAAKMIGRHEDAQRLFGSLEVDIAKTRDTLGWIPPYSLEAGLRECYK